MLQHGLIHLANLVYLASYSVKNVRVLRWLTIVGIMFLIPYFLILGLWEPVIWNSIFLSINLYRLFSDRKIETPIHEHRGTA